jgi:predicted metal-dependent peptidase
MRKIEKGDYEVIAEVVGPDDREQDAKKGGGDFKILSDPKKMKRIPKVGEETPADRKTGEFGKSTIKTKATEVKNRGKSDIYRGKIKTGPDWKKIARQALDRGQVPEGIRKMLNKIMSDSPSVNWKRELKKLFDAALRQSEWRLPNKRFIHSGTYLYGRYNTGISTLKTIVAAVDTSGSISKKQSELFLSEIQHLCKMVDAERLYIIYCSDDIDGVDDVRRGKKIDFSKWASTGGNSNGFIPPFQLIQEKKIVPSAFIYFTDTGGQMPDPDQYGISRYKDKVIWFLASPEIYNTPPFGKHFYVPLSQIK